MEKKEIAAKQFF
jgi:hypothetical protein